VLHSQGSLICWADHCDHHKYPFYQFSPHHFVTSCTLIMPSAYVINNWWWLAMEQACSIVKTESHYELFSRTKFPMSAIARKRTVTFNACRDIQWLTQKLQATRKPDL
jgi:hypothetical protein